MKRFSILGLILLIGTSFAYYPISQPIPFDRVMSIQSPHEVSDEACGWWYYWWTGIGDLTIWGVSNTGQGPIFSPRVLGEIPPYTGSITQQGEYQRDLERGRNAVYPAGTAQPYTFAAGGWVGALYPVIVGEDTTWDTVVCKCAYYCDLGAMKVPEMENAGEEGNISDYGLYFSDMIIPAGFSHEEDYLFKQPGMTKESWQTLWPFADTSINKRRPEGTELDPAEGDIVSMEDTYAVCGDWIPADDARVIWANPGGGPYQGRGMGIRMEVRTYSWNYDYNRDYIYVNYKIRNMNAFPLKDVYLAYFMDNDIGHADEPQGAWDDAIGFDKELNLGYTYDTDGFELGWKATPGYIGCVLVETPEDIGLTGFLSWLNDPDVYIDVDTADGLKYKEMAKDSFQTWEEPQDVRQLSACGPIKELKPNEEISFTVAIVVAPTLTELKEKTKTAIIQFETGYLGFAPPYPPTVNLRPGDGRVYVSWDTRAENFIDLMSGQRTFEGYRVYRSRTGLTGEWTLLADYDLFGSYTKDTVTTKYATPTSKATISFVGLEEKAEEVFGDNQYTIMFTDSATIMDTLIDTLIKDTVTGETEIDTSFHYMGLEYVIHDVNKGKLCLYNPAAIEDGEGYFVVNQATGNPYDSFPGYISGSKIYIDGFYVAIKNGEYNPAQPRADTTVNPGDAFVIKSYKKKPTGPQVGIRHFLVDSTVTNGVTYYYTVTSYSRELPEYEVGSLESGKTGKLYWTIPRKEPVDRGVAGVDTITHTKGKANVLVDAVIVYPDSVTGDEYKINFYPEEGDTTETIKYWRFTNTKTGRVLLDDVTALKGEKDNPIKEGLVISVDAVTTTGIDTETVYDTVKTGWIEYDSLRGGWVEGEPNYKFKFKPEPERLPPHDYTILFTKEGGEDVFGKRTPFVMRDSTLRKVPVFLWTGDTDKIKDADEIKVYEKVENNIPRIPLFSMGVLHPWTWSMDSTLTPIPPEVGDIYYVKTLKPVTREDEFTIKTASGMEEIPPDEFSLDSVRVVPNPYYIRAIWDKSKVEQRIYFQGLPTDTTCTIRIFNAAGLLIREIKPDEYNLDGGAKYWDLYTSDQLRAVSGLYIYQVTTKNGKSKVGKFVIIR